MPSICTAMAGTYLPTSLGWKVEPVLAENTKINSVQNLSDPESYDWKILSAALSLKNLDTRF